MEKIRCQSCGMPLGTEGYYGTNADGSEEKTYCKFCFQFGKFTQPGMTLQDMIESSVHFMTKDLGFTEIEASRISHEIIPGLKRWKKTS